MQLPNKAYDPNFVIDFSEISYFPKKNSLETSLSVIYLPKWLEDLISSTVKKAKDERAAEVRDEIRKALGV